MSTETIMIANSLKAKIRDASPNWIMQLYDHIKFIYRRYLIAEPVSIEDYTEQSVQDAIQVVEKKWQCTPNIILTKQSSTEFLSKAKNFSKLHNLSQVTSSEFLIFCATRINPQLYASLVKFIKNGGNVIPITIVKLYLKLVEDDCLSKQLFIFDHPVNSQEVSNHSIDSSTEKAPVDLSDSYNFRILFGNLNLLYYEVPKSASSSIKTMLFSIENESRYNQDYQRYIPTIEWQKKFPAMKVNWEDIIYSPFLKFAFLRNPYERLASGYFNTGWHYVNEGISFEEFIASIPEKLKSPPSDMINIHYQPFTYFVPKINGKLHIDFIGKVENFNEDIKVILDACNVVGDFEIPKINKSKKPSYQDLYTSRTKKVVETLYAEDIELGKYSF